MASRKTAAPVQQSDIKLGGKSKKDAALLARLVAQEGRAVLPFLDDVLAQGSLVMRRAAITHLGQLDPKKGEKYVRDALKAPATSKKGAADRDELVTWYALVGSPSSLQRFLDEGRQLDEVDVAIGTVSTLYEVVAAEVAGADLDTLQGRLAQVSLLDDRGRLRMDALQKTDEARTLARALLAHGEAQARGWGALLLAELDGIRALDEVRRSGVELDFDSVYRMCIGQPDEVKLELLARFLGTEDHRRRILTILTGKLDPRWFPLLEQYLDDTAVAVRLAHGGHPRVLTRLRAQADSSTFDRATQQACYALGQARDAQATPILLRWLADPVGRQASPMLLTALGECAGPDAIPTIERLSQNEPGRANFYAHAVASIRHRGG